MACYHMNLALIDPDRIIKKNGNSGDHINTIVFANSKDFKGYEYYEKWNKTLEERGEKARWTKIPCGKCIGCRKKERMDWSIRIECEAKQYDHNYFITLTYNEENLVIPEYTVDKNTGEIFENDGTWKGTIVKEHQVQFIKSLRQYFKREFDHDGMKFYGCHEYGTKGERPHMHIILMNCPNLDDQLICIGRNKKTGDPYYTHKRIEQIWHKGFITIGKVNWQSISYTAGYTAKKLGDFKTDSLRKGQEPISAFMSRRPGIGKAYFNLHQKEIYDIDEIINGKGQSVKPPGYFDRLMEDIGEEDILKEVKKLRKEYSENELKKKMQGTQKNQQMQYQIEENITEFKQKIYNRNRIK